MPQPTVANQVAVSLQQQFHVRAGERVGVAVSGGADSVALLLVLLELREKLGIVLSVLHFNHKLRGKLSDADEKFVAKLATGHGLAFHVDRADVAAEARREKTNLEDAARRARYSFFARLVAEGRVDRVAVAHTADDQAETVLAHILRGTGLAGLGGIHPIAGSVIRPLLKIRRSELRRFLRNKNQNWREDATNRDTTRMRARIRTKLLPLLEKQFNLETVAHLSTLAELARRDEAFLTALAHLRSEALAQKEVHRCLISAADLLRPLAGMVFDAENSQSAGMPVNEAVSARMVRWLVDSVKTRTGELSAKHVDAVLDLACRGKSGKSLPLPGGVEVRRERDALVFCGITKAAEETAPASSGGYEFPIDLARTPQEVRVPQLGCAFRFRVIDWPSARGETIKDGVVLDRDRLRSPLVLRNWRPGDRMRSLGHRSAHKLKRFFNEKRISRWKRQGWPVMTSAGVLVWARGFPVAAEFAADERTRTGIVIAEESL